ncbi:MAG: Flp pilus assembly complex ATPase component TadA [Alphaproteobacteria bacterium]|nr:Flp pilus assembly complex ATPase component TadA [Alphaproteobacteria bacterium]
MTVDPNPVDVSREDLEQLTPGEPVTANQILRVLRGLPREQLLEPREGAAPYSAAARQSNRARSGSAVVRRMLEGLGLGGEARVLEIGTGTGFATAALASLVREVYSVEREATLAQAALVRLHGLGLENVHVQVGDGLQGWAEHAPYDAILVSARASQVPQALLGQLVEGGRLVALVGTSRVRQDIVRFTRAGTRDYLQDRLGEVRFLSELGDILVETGACDRATAEQARSLAQSSGQPERKVLMETFGVSEADVWRGLALQHGLSFATVDALLQRADPRVHRRVSRRFLEDRHVVPIGLSGGRLTLATSVPEISPHEVVRAYGATELESYLVSPTDYRRLWVALDLERTAAPRVRPDARAVDSDLLEDAAKVDTLFVDLFEALLLEAIGERASDIHLERYADRTRMRVRVDGVLNDVPRLQLSEAEHRGVVNVLKVAAGLDITEHRLPQAGRFRRRAGEAAYDMRLLVQPGLYGENIVLRLLEEESGALPLHQLGFPEDALRHYRRLLDSPAGMVLVVGPTGAGKTTTLYAGLRILAKDPSRKVITIEDPVEYAIEGVQQVAVRPDLGFHYADALKAFLHQDPDVILLGEIRDEETAMQAVRASQTGHLLLTTAHSNDAVDAVQRLLDLDLAPNSLSSELIAVISQRLARRICEGCRRPAEPEPRLLAELFPEGAPEDFACFEGAGCARCGGRGTWGRVPVVELLSVDDDLRRAISGRVSVGELRAQAVASGMIPARERALTLVREGVIPVTELPRVLTLERMRQRLS